MLLLLNSYYFANNEALSLQNWVFMKNLTAFVQPLNVFPSRTIFTNDGFSLKGTHLLRFP